MNALPRQTPPAASPRWAWRVLLAASSVLAGTVMLGAPAWAQNQRAMPTLQTAPNQPALAAPPKAPGTAGAAGGAQGPSSSLIPAIPGVTTPADNGPPPSAPGIAAGTYAPNAPAASGAGTAYSTQTGVGTAPQGPQALSAQDAATVREAVRVLVQQAAFWRDQFQPERATDALNRALQLDPHNPDALAVLAQLQADSGNRSAATATLAQLRVLMPNDARIGKIEQAISIGVIDQQALDQARSLAQAGRNDDAVAIYQRLFRGNPPPDRLALEYYQTLAGTQSGWDAARVGLGELVITNPNDLRLQLAYAQVLTYREDTRAEGIARLAQLAVNSQAATQANDALHQTMLWLPADASSIPYFTGYLQTHPNDTAVAQRLAEAQNPQPLDPIAAARMDAYNKLNAGQLDAAADGFGAVLATNQDDADALGGLGIVRLRQGRRPEARDLLGRAIQIDPEHRDRWMQAYNGSVQTATGGGVNPNSSAQQYAQVRVLADRGDYEGAERLLNRITGGRNNAAMSLGLADIQSRSGRLAEAEQSYRAVLQGQPRNVEALIGLGGVLMREGRTAEANDLFARAEATGNKTAVARARSLELQARAQAAGDPATQAALLRAAYGYDPTNPWLRLDLARALARSGQVAEARGLMGGAVEARNPSTDTLKSALIYAQEENDSALASAIIGRIPSRARTADMRALLAQAQAQQEVASAVASWRANPMAARARLLALAARPDPSGQIGAMVARALVSVGDIGGARQALSSAMGANPRMGNDAKLSYAGALLSAGDLAQADQILGGVEQQRNMSADQQRAVDGIRAGIAVRTADALNQQGRQADAYDQLAPALARQPANPDLNMALARLYSAADRPKQALELSINLLRRDPNNLDVRRSAVDAAIAASDYSTAERLAAEATQAQPNEPKSWMIAAEVDRARGNSSRALHDLQMARDLRTRQLGVSLLLAGSPHVELTQATGYAGRPTSLLDNFGAVPPSSYPASAQIAAPAAPVAAPTQMAQAATSYFPSAPQQGNEPAPITPSAAYPNALAPGALTSFAPAAPPPTQLAVPQGSPAPQYTPQYTPQYAPQYAPAPLARSIPDSSPSPAPAPSYIPAPAPSYLPAQIAAPSDTMPRTGAGYLPYTPPVAAPVASSYAPPPVNYAPPPISGYAPVDSGNPFRSNSSGGSPLVASSTAVILPNGAGGSTQATTSDPLMQDIDQQIRDLDSSSGTRFSAGFSLRSRTGTGGLDKLTEAMVPVEATFSPNGSTATFRLQATPTYLSSGSFTSPSGKQALYGYLPNFGNGPPSYPAVTTSASGIGLDAAMLWRWVNVDVGTSPLGFREANVIGGVEVAPKVGQNATLRLTLERRAVTDSLLSFGGAVDPVTHRTWGGVTRTRGHIQLEGSSGLLNLYAGAGYALLDGTSVASNQEFEFGAGGTYPVFRFSDNQEVRVGLDLVYFAYNRNERSFTFGNGGYFSPQSYAAALVPVTYTGKDGAFSWSVGATVGWQSFTEKNEAIYPTDPASQAILQTYGPPNGYSAFLPSNSQSGFSGGLHGEVDYAVSDNLHVGARGSLSHTGDWSETTGLLYARYLFDGVR